MKQYDMHETKINFSKIAKLLENKVEDRVIINRNGKPFLEIKLYEENDRTNFFGCAKGLFKIPNNFDDIDLANDFE